MKKHLLTLICATSICAGTSAQTLLGGAEFSAKIIKNLSVDAGVEYRTAEWVQHTNQWSAEASVDYKPLKFLKFSAGYKFIQEQIQSYTNEGNGEIYPDYWNDKHRVSISAIGNLKLGKFNLSLRERYQYTYRPEHIIPILNDDYANHTISGKSSHILRSRLQGSFKPKKKSPWEPYASFELYTILRNVNHTKSNKTTGAKFYDKFRVTAGCEYKINKHNSFDIFYRYVRSVDTDDNDSPHTIGIVYSFSL